MKINITSLTSSLLLIAALNTSYLKADFSNPPLTQDEFAQKEQLFATSVGNLLSLEDTKPKLDEGTTAVKVTADLESSILNLLASTEDYFHLVTPKVLLSIEDKIEKNDQGVNHHHYSPKAGKEKNVIGYLVCLDAQKTENTVSAIAKKEGADSYTIYNTATGTRKSLCINLEYDYLSPEILDHLYSAYYDTANQGVRTQADYVWIDRRTFTGTDLKESTIPETVFTLGLSISLNDESEDSGYDYGYIYKRKDDKKEYHPKQS
jgi:hypothetical protein